MALYNQNNLKVAKLHPLWHENSGFNTPEIPSKFTWTVSALKTFRTCKRLFFWTYIAKIKKRTPSLPLIVGSAMHSILSRWYATEEVMKDIVQSELVKLEKQHLTYQSQIEPKKWNHALHTIEASMLGYSKVYQLDKINWIVKPEHCETELRIDMGDFWFAGKIDMIAQENGENIIVEHKSASTITESYISKLPLDSQVRAYIFLAYYCLKIMGNKVCYDVIKKPTIRQKKEETDSDFITRLRKQYTSLPHENFYREKLSFRKSDINAFVAELYQTHKEYESLLIDSDDPTDPRVWTGNDSACSHRFGSTCEFLSCCTVGIDKGNAINFEQKDTTHEELSFIDE